MRSGGERVVEVQIFGTKNDAETRKALRFFSERRIRTHFVDLKERAASKGELRRFVDRHGIDAVLDRGSKRLRGLGLHTALYGPDRWLDILAEEPLLLRTPLVRSGKHLTVGYAEEEWKAWLEAERG
jgi:arsenate reductase-like glutaredoxin family protein